MTTKQLTLLLFALIVLFLIALVGRVIVNRTIVPVPSPLPSVSVFPSPSSNPVMCTMDAKMCPDGSYVGRVGPNCDFALCPVGGGGTVSTTTGTFTVSLGQKNESMGVSVLLVEIIEDSRCALEVQCIQAGTVRVRGEVTQKGDTKAQIFTLGQSVRLQDRTLTLVQVMPDPHAGTNISPSAYRFTFEVKK